MTSESPPPPRPKRPGFWGWLHLQVALRRMAELNKAGADLEIIQRADRFRVRWKGNAAFYERLSGAHWGASHGREAVRFGRMALAIDSSRAQALVFRLAGYRSWNPAQGILVGENWLRRHGVDGKVCRHLSFLYDDLDRPAEALAVARRGWEWHRRDRRLAACVANYLAKAEGADSALRFARANKLLTGDPYAPDTVANGLSAVRAHAPAEKIFADLHRRFPANAKYLVSLLDALYHQDRHQEVLAVVERWRKRFQMTGPVANEAGRACLELGRNDEALAWMRRAVELSPTASKFADNHAVSLGRAGRHAEGIEAARQRLAAPDSPDRRRLLSSLAVDHTNLGRHAEALAFYQQAFAEFPGHGDTLVDLIAGHSWLDRWEDAAAFGLQFRDTRGPALPVRYWSELAWALHRAGRFAEEEAVIRDWQRLHPDDPNVVRTMKRALNSLKRPGEAVAFGQAWVNAHPAVVDGWRYLAEQHETMGDFAAQLAALEEGCRRAPGDAGLAAERIAALRRLRRPREAFDLGVAWDAAHPGRVTAELLNRVGLAADDLEDWAGAERFLWRAHTIEPDHGVWLGNLLRVLILSQRAQAAVAAGNAWRATHPWSGPLVLRLAWAMRESGLRAEEGDLLREAVAAAPRDEEWHYLLLANLTARNLTDEAAALVAAAREAGAGSSRILNNWANHLRDIGRTDASEAAYREALAQGPDNDTAAGNLVSLLALAGRLDAAVACARDWLARRPDDHYVRRQLAEAYYDHGDYPPAEAEFRRARAGEPASPFLAGRVVACLRLLDKFAEALAEGAAWLQAQPGTPFLYIEMGIAAHALDQPQDALRHYESALQLEPASAAAALRKLRVLDGQQRWAEAMDFGRAWCAAHPAAAGAEFHNELGILLDRRKRPAEAQDHFVRATELDPHNATLAGNAVEILARRGHLAESLRLGQRALAAAPPNAYLLRRLAEAYGGHHEHAAALDLLGSADVLEPAAPEIAREFLRLAQEGDELERGIAFGRAWLARPDNARQAGVWSRFARICFRADEDDEALAAAERAREIEPDDIAHEQLRFGFWNALDDSHRLTREFEALRPEWRDDPVLLRHASRASAELGMAEEALQLARRNAQANPADDEACAWLAELHERNGETALARECIRSWIALHGEHRGVLKVRADLAWRENAHSAALADAEKVLEGDGSDEDMFVLSIRALRELGRGGEARTRLNRWLEHQGSSRRIVRLMDEEGGE